jgi:excisionase family DNA binding protein
MAALHDDFIRPAEAARRLHVSPQTIGRWAREGRLTHVVTLGGHHRFLAAEIERLAATPVPRQPVD